MTDHPTIKLSDFSKTPGGRYASDGEHSAEEFREEHLLPFMRAISGTVVIDLSGTAGIAASFLEEALGGMVRSINDDDSTETGHDVASRIFVEHDGHSWFTDMAREFMGDAAKYDSAEDDE